MSRIKFKKRHHLLWDVNTGEILLDYEATNPRTVTETDREDIAGCEFDSRTPIDTKIEQENLKYKETDDRFEPAELTETKEVKEPAETEEP
jgi:hypothetical protein